MPFGCAAGVRSQRGACWTVWSASPVQYPGYRVKAAAGPAEPAPSRKPKGDPEELFAAQCRSYRLPRFEQQHYFAKSIGRRWRFDFAFPDYKLAVEIEGLVVRRVWEAKLEGGAPVLVKGYVMNVTNCSMER